MRSSVRTLSEIFLSTQLSEWWGDYHLKLFPKVQFSVIDHLGSYSDSFVILIGQRKWCYPHRYAVVIFCDHKYSEQFKSVLSPEEL